MNIHMATSELDNTTLTFTSNGTDANVILTATASNLDFEGVSSANCSLTGINTLTAENATISTALTNSALTSGRVVIAGTAGILEDDADLTFSTGTNTLNSTLLTIDSESIAGVRIFYAYDSVGGVTVTNAAQVMDFDTSVITDTGYTESAGVVTITDTGVYEVSFTVSGESVSGSGAARGTFSAQIELDTGGGFSAVSGSLTVGYQRETVVGVVLSLSVTKTIPVDITVADTDLRIVFFDSTSTDWDTLADSSTLYIKRLRP